MESLRRTANKVDDVVFKVERLLLLVCLAAMTVLVSLDVVQRTFSRPVGKTEGALLAVFYTAPTDAQVAFVTGTLGPVLFGLFAFFLLLPAVFGDDRGGWPRRVLANPVLAWLGLVSYGIYLWHASLMIWLDEQGAAGWVAGLSFPGLLVVTTAFATACAAASYYLVERPLLRFKDPRRPPIRPKPVLTES